MKPAAAGWLVLLALAGCATAPPPRDSGWVTGRISVSVAATATQGSQGMSAAFELRGSGDSGELRLNSPLGSRVADATWAPGRAELVSGDGTQTFATLDELSQRALGESLPLAALPDWLAGRPWPRAPHRPVEGGFEQMGWQVVLARRAEGVIEARRAAPPAVQVRVKLDPIGNEPPA